MRKKGLLVNKKLKDPDYVESRYRLLCADEKKWDHFHNFECSDFFQGKTLAKLNRKEYYNAMRPIWRQKRILEKIIYRQEGNNEV